MSVQPLDDVFAGHAGPWTEEEWLALPETMGRVELVDGTLLVSPHPAFPHQRLVVNLTYVLRVAAPAGMEVLEAVNIRVSPGRIMIPDIAVLATPGLQGVISDAASVMLAVEVTSPSTGWADRLVKPDAYARGGIPHYLRIDLDRGVDQLGATAYELTPGGTYAEAARASDAGRLVLDRPFPIDLDLTTLATATRYPRR